MGTRLGSIGHGTGGWCAPLAAALALALGGGGAQAAPAGAAASGRVVSEQAVPPASAPVARATATHVPVAGSAVVVDAAPLPRAAATAPRAHSAVARGATISGFAFHPGSITVTAGDTISWTNDDSAPHTATADDGSFDTGQLAKGASGSHMFTTAGTFAYHCVIHPSMHGTVTVIAAASGGGSASGGVTSAPPAAASSPAPSTTAAPATLPRTGWNPAAVAAAGVALLLAGLMLRARTQSR